MIQRLTLILAPLALCSCAVFVNNPNPHVEVPEVRGDHGLTIGAELSGGHQYQASPDASTRPPNISDPNTTASVDPNAKVLYSPADPLALGLEVHEQGISLLTKFQLSGEGSRHAQAGDWPVGVYLRVGGGHNENNGTQQDLFGPGGYPWKSSISSLYVHGGTSMGYRFNERVLLYWGAAGGLYWNRSEIDQDTATNAPGGVYKAGDSGYAVTVGPGVFFSWSRVQFYVATEFVHLEYHGAGTANDFQPGAGITITPGGSSSASPSSVNAGQ